MKVVLRARLPGKEILFEVGSMAVTLGRGESVHVQLADSNCSRSHCRFFIENNKFWLEDMASKNGTFVNGVRIQKSQIFIQDNMTIGDTEISIPADKNSAAIVQLLHFEGDTQERQRKNIEVQDTGEFTHSRHHPLTALKTPSIELARSRNELKSNPMFKKSMATGTPKQIEIKAPPSSLVALANAVDYGGLLFAATIPIFFSESIQNSSLLTGVDLHFVGIKRLTLSAGLCLLSGFIFWLINTKNSGGSIGERIIDRFWYDRQKKN